MSLQATEAASAEVAKTANRVSLKTIEDAIAEAYFFNLRDAVVGAGSQTPEPSDRLKTLTMCVLVFRNGFIQIGYTAPADPENFNADVGRRFAREHAIREAWSKFGFALCEQLADDAHKTLSPSIFETAAAARVVV